MYELGCTCDVAFCDSGSGDVLMRVMLMLTVVVWPVFWSGIGELTFDGVSHLWSYLLDFCVVLVSLCFFFLCFI